MIRRGELNGVIALPCIPFSKNGNIDEDLLRENYRKLITYGFDGLAVLGTYGEFYNISDQEHKSICRILAEEANGKVLTIAGTSHMNTAASIRRTKIAEDYGIGAVMNVVPFYWPLNDREAIQYWKDLAEACPNIGLMVYNNPHTTQYFHQPEVYHEIAEIPTVIGAKEVSPDFFHHRECTLSTGLQHLCVEHYVVESMFWGERGYMPSVLYGFPHIAMEIYKLCIDQDWEEAKKLHARIWSFLQKVWKIGIASGGYSRPAFSKTLVGIGGFIEWGDPRKPLEPLSQKVRDEIRRVINEEFPDFLYQS